MVLQKYREDVIIFTPASTEIETIILKKYIIVS